MKKAKEIILFVHFYDCSFAKIDIFDTSPSKSKSQSYKRNFVLKKNELPVHSNLTILSYDQIEDTVEEIRIDLVCFKTKIL